MKMNSEIRSSAKYEPTPMAGQALYELTKYEAQRNTNEYEHTKYE